MLLRRTRTADIFYGVRQESARLFSLDREGIDVRQETAWSLAHLNPFDKSRNLLCTAQAPVLT